MVDRVDQFYNLISSIVLDSILLAYEVLTDEEKRRIYDQYGEDGLKEGGRASFRSPFDIFSS